MAGCLRYDRIVWASALAVGLVAACASSAQAAGGSLRRFGAQIDIADNAMSGLIAGGASVHVKGRSTARIVLVGADVQIDAEIFGSLYAGGANVAAAGKVSGDVDVAGGEIALAGSVEGDVTAIGGRIDVARTARFDGQTSLTGGRVTLAGQTKGAVAVEASEVEISGEIKGPLKIEASHLHITDQAVIDGDIDATLAAEPVIDSGAKLNGKLTRNSLVQTSALRALSADGPWARLMPSLFLLGSALVAGLLLIWLGRGTAEAAIDELIDSPLANGVRGLVALVIVPIAVLLLSLTIIGAPVGALTLMAFPLLVLLGYACAGLGLGEWLFNRLGDPKSSGHRALHLLSGLVGLGALGLIPWVGLPILALATLCGFGALLLTLSERLRGNAGHLS